MVEHDEQEAEVQILRIDVDGRYIVVITAPRALDAEELHRAHTVLRQWWESGEKFLLLEVHPEVGIRLERVDAPE